MADRLAQFRAVHAALIEDSHAGFVQTVDGEIHHLDELPPAHHGEIVPINVFPGSFNPIHDSHRAIYGFMPGSEDPNKAIRKHPTQGSYLGLKTFEISIERTDKEFLPADELMRRCDQLLDYAPILITRAPLFLEKTGILVGRYMRPTFFIGYDTFQRIMDAHGPTASLGIAANFVVFDRKINDKIYSIQFYEARVPDNFERGPVMEEFLLGLSSTQIREELAAHQAAQATES